MRERKSVKNMAFVVLFLAVFCMAWLSFGQTVKADITEGLWQYRVDNGSVTITQYTGDMPVVEIPSTLGGKTVTALGRNVFPEKKNMHTVKIPSSVRTIEGNSGWDGCFRNCTGLVTVEGLQYVTSIGPRAFIDCTALENFTFGSGLKEIGNYAFQNTALAPESFKLPASLKSIGAGAFKACNTITSVTIPASVTTIGAGAFCNCENLVSANIQASCWIGNGVYDDGAFQNCKKLSSVEIGPSVTGIGNNVFKEDAALKTVTFGAGVQSIGNSAFYNCSLLETVDLPAGVRTIGQSAFEGCSALREISLKYGLLEIAGYAFKKCIALEMITIPNSVTVIGKCAFGNCTALTEITIPNSVQEFPNNWYPVFDNDGEITVYGYAGSKAEEYVGNYENLTFSALQTVICDNLVLAEETIDMKKGETRKIGYTMTPPNTTDAIQWSSSEPNIVSVNQLGEITAKGAGSVTITMITTSGLDRYITVTVKEITKVSFAVSNKTISIGETYTQKAEVRDNIGIRYDVVPAYSSSNPAIATVNANGEVKGLKSGYATITARVEDRSGSYRIRVIAPSSSENGTGNGTGTVVTKNLGKIKISKKGKVLTVKTVAGATVKVSAKKSVLGKSLKTVKANSKGTAKIKFKKKIKKVTVTVKVSKAGYLTKTEKKKFKK